MEGKQTLKHIDMPLGELEQENIGWRHVWRDLSVQNGLKYKTHMKLRLKRIKDEWFSNIEWKNYN